MLPNRSLCDGLHMRLWKEHGNYFSGGYVCCWWSVKLPAGQDTLCSILHWLDTTEPILNTLCALCFFFLQLVFYWVQHFHRTFQILHQFFFSMEHILFLLSLNSASLHQHFALICHVFHLSEVYPYRTSTQLVLFTCLPSHFSHSPIPVLMSLIYSYNIKKIKFCLGITDYPGTIT